MKAAAQALVLLGVTVAVAAVRVLGADDRATETVVIRGRPQTLRLYGSRGSGDPVIVSSGDGGWIHLGPEVAQSLAAKGFFVVGFDTRAYLEGFTSGSTALRLDEVPDDYRTLVDYAARGSSKKPILIGVSEGAGLSALAATDARTRQGIAGIVALGLPEVNELGWRWKDSLIYVTHQVPKEPTFTSASVVSQLAATPLAAIHSTRDEFVSVKEVQTILKSVSGPATLMIVKATDHRFSGSLPEFHQRLLEAIDWVRQHQPA